MTSDWTESINTLNDKIDELNNQLEIKNVALGILYEIYAQSGIDPNPLTMEQWIKIAENIVLTGKNSNMN